MSEIEVTKIAFGILLSLGTAVLLFLSFKLYYKCLIQEKRCTAKTKGIVKKYTFANRGGENSGVHLPVVYYNINNKEYKVIGPVYKYYKTKTISTPITPITKTEMEFHETEDHGLVIKRKVNSIITIMKNPMSELYPKGSEIDVYYDPDNPKLAYVLRYCNRKWMFWLMFISAISVLFMDLFILFFL